MAQALVIDDEAQILLAVQRCLEGAGITVVTAPSAADGLTAAAAIRPDLIVLDLGLPDLDGLDVITRLRSWTQAPIIVLSGAGDERSKVAALGAGADDYVTKPFSLAELRARAEATLRRAGAGNTPSPVRRFEGIEVDLDDLQVAATARSCA